ANPQVRFYASPEDAAGTERPQTGLSWYDAAMYCRWLSEQEGIPEDQMCYPPIPEILKCADGLTPLRLPPDHLSRKGYRLPTEAEWEFASRAGADGPRYYGDGDDLLPAYAWFIHNSHERTWPVGQKKPNDFGLFDTLGNAFECCQGTYRAFRPGTRGRPAGDEEDRTPMTDRVNRVMRGGSYTYTAANQRAASRLTNRPPARLQTDGFRIARTCDPPETQPSP
ncbi:MAG TPA: SUMF1/EgtB/PvdO family nonheme iron enzyme, partial [Gemmataceae bacterium]|nr:SUMF1/EgtB/PvdO family nonheme iron enzyme [Gemmataceae bacterium]